MSDSKHVATGVQELIGRLRDDGVQAGRQEAERLISEAKDQANDILERAKADSCVLREKTLKEIEAERSGAHDALQLAVRDAVLDLKSTIREHFTAQVKRLVTLELEDKEFLRQMILAVAGQASSVASQNKSIEILLAERLFDEANTEKETGKVIEDRMQHLIMGISNEMLRSGVELKSAGNDRPGLRLHIIGEDLEIDLTEKAVSELLLKHLLPRFRDGVQGMD